MLEALVLLGAPARSNGRPGIVASRRAARAARAWHEGRATHIVVCGGRRWFGVSETVALARWLESEHAVPRRALVRELRSLSTAENARFCAELLGGSGRVGVVTCYWHMARALASFRAAGLDPCPMPARADLGQCSAVRRRVQETVSWRLDRLATWGWAGS